MSERPARPAMTAGQYVSHGLDEWQWQDEAVCNSVDIEIFFPEPADFAAIRAAKKVCSRCPVVVDCLEAGINEEHGIWGGHTTYERARLRSQIESSPQRRGQLIETSALIVNNRTSYE